MVPDGHRFASIIKGDRYSEEFEECWSYVCTSALDKTHLEGMSQTIQELLSPEWEIMSCSRCDMPVPMLTLGTNHGSCPCSDLELWPNLELPQPRLPVDSDRHLLAIQSRLLANLPALEQAPERV